MSEEEQKKLIECTVDDDDDGDIIAVTHWNEDDEKVISDKYKTKFILCSARCVRKLHVGYLKDNIWACGFIMQGSTHPFEMLGNAIKEMCDSDVVSDD